MKSRVYFALSYAKLSHLSDFSLKKWGFSLDITNMCYTNTTHNTDRGTWVLHQLNSPHKSEGFWGSQCPVTVWVMYLASQDKGKQKVYLLVKIQARRKGPEQKKHQNLNGTASKMHTITWCGTGYWFMLFLLFLLTSLCWRSKKTVSELSLQTRIPYSEQRIKLETQNKSHCFVAGHCGGR